MFFLDDDAYLTLDIKPALKNTLASDERIAAVGFPIWEDTLNSQLYGFKTGTTKCFAAGAVYIDRTAFEEIGGFDERIEWSEEFDLALRLWGAGWKIWTADGPLVHHHAESSTSRHTSEKIEKIVRL